MQKPAVASLFCQLDHSTEDGNVEHVVSDFVDNQRFISSIPYDLLKSKDTIHRNGYQYRQSLSSVPRME
jgi:hypothetical protein